MNSEDLNRNKDNDVVSRIIAIPQKFRQIGNVSVYSLLDQTGYFEIADNVSEVTIRDALVKCDECVLDWIQYSEDKRTPSGWYVVRRDDGKYEVGWLAKEGRCEKRTNYEDAIDAVASFIKREIESMRSIANR